MYTRSGFKIMYVFVEMEKNGIISSVSKLKKIYAYVGIYYF